MTALTADPAAELVRLVLAGPDGSCGAILAPSRARGEWMLRVSAARAGLRVDGDALHLGGGRSIVVVHGAHGARGWTLLALWACESMARLDVEASSFALAASRGTLLR